MSLFTNQQRFAHSAPLSLFTYHCEKLIPLLFRDAIFFSSPRLAKKRRQIRCLDYWQFGGSNVPPHRACSLPSVDSALAKIRFLDFLLARACHSLRFHWFVSALAPRTNSLRSCRPSENPQKKAKPFRVLLK